MTVRVTPFWEHPVGVVRGKVGGEDAVGSDGFPERNIRYSSSATPDVMVVRPGVGETTSVSADILFDSHLFVLGPRL